MLTDPVLASESRHLASMDDAEARGEKLAELIEEENKSDVLPEDFAILLAEQMGTVEQTILRDLIVAYEGPELARFLAPYARRVIEQAARERAEKRMQRLERARGRV